MIVENWAESMLLRTGCGLDLRGVVAFWGVESKTGLADAPAYVFLPSTLTRMGRARAAAGATVGGVADRRSAAGVTIYIAISSRDVTSALKGTACSDHTGSGSSEV